MAGGLQDELKQARPFRSLEEELYLNIARTSAVLDHELVQALKPFDITPTQYNVLSILRGAGPDGLCRGDIAIRLVRQVPDVTRLLDRMEDMSLITRSRQGHDRRFVRTRITAAGLELVAHLDAEVCRIHQEQLGHLDQATQKRLVALLTAVRKRSGT